MLYQDRAGSLLGASIRAYTLVPASAGRGYAEAGASPSSEVPPEEPLEAIGRRRLSTKRWAARSVRRCTWESDSPEGARVIVGCRSW